MDKKWSQFYRDHGRFYLLPHPSFKKFLTLAHKNNYKKILDMGCGSGRHVVALAENGFEAYGIDFSPSAAQLAEKWLHEKGLEAEIIVGDFEDNVPDFEDHTFDGITAINTLEYGDQGELERNLLQINRLLKEQGLIMIVMRSKESKLKHPEVPTQFFDEEQLKKMFQVFFRIIDIHKDKNHNWVIIAEKKRK